eukprot:632172-Amphidinium_carterae.1
MRERRIPQLPPIWGGRKILLHCARGHVFLQFSLRTSSSNCTVLSSQLKVFSTTETPSIAILLHSRKSANAVANPFLCWCLHGPHLHSVACRLTFICVFAIEGHAVAEDKPLHTRPRTLDALAKTSSAQYSPHSHATKPHLIKTLPDLQSVHCHEFVRHAAVGGATSGSHLLEAVLLTPWLIPKPSLAAI